MGEPLVLWVLHKNTLSLKFNEAYGRTQRCLTTDKYDIQRCQRLKKQLFTLNENFVLTYKGWEAYFGNLICSRLLHLITFWSFFYISNECFQLLTIFKCLNQAVLMADVLRSKFKQENQSKTSEQHQTSLNSLDWRWQKKTFCTSKHGKQQNEYYLTDGLNFLQKIFRCNPLCNHEHFHE